MRVIDKISKRKIASCDNVLEIVKLVLNSKDTVEVESEIRHYKCVSGNVEIGIVSDDNGSRIKISVLVTNIVSVVMMQLVAYKNKPSEYYYKVLTGSYLEDEFDEMYLHKKGMNSTYDSIVELGFSEPTSVNTFGDLFLPK